MNLDGPLSKTTRFSKLTQNFPLTSRDKINNFDLVSGCAQMTPASSREPIVCNTSTAKLTINRAKMIRITHSKTPINIRINRSKPVLLRETLSVIRERQRSADYFTMEGNRRHRKRAQYLENAYGISSDIAFLKQEVIDSAISTS